MWKKIGKIVLCILVVFSTIYGLLVYSLYSSWSGVPMLAYGSVSAGVVLFEIAVSMFLSKSSRKKILLIAFIGSLVCIIFGASYQMLYLYDKNIPRVVDDDELIFTNYTPFTEGNKTVKMNSDLKLEENLPRLDGATALYPVYASIAENVYPNREYLPWKYGEEYSKEEESLVVCSKTPNAYDRLINKETDIIFVAAPSDKQLEDAKKAGVELELTPIGKEAFVFFVNTKNPVDNLTVKQIQQIYSGEITNWKQAGGNDERIRAFQRPEGSGSQSALLRLMKGHTLIKPLEEDVVIGMGGIIHQTANYKNYKNAIGYSFRFYSTELVKEKKIRHLAINGVQPTRENIINKTYPITNDFYAVTLKNHTNPNIDLLLDWIKAEQGQHLIEEVGYTSLLEE